MWNFWKTSPSKMLAGTQQGQCSLLLTACIHGPCPYPRADGHKHKLFPLGTAQLSWVTAPKASRLRHLLAKVLKLEKNPPAGLEEMYSKKKGPNHVKTLCLNTAFLSSAIFDCYSRKNLNIKCVNFLIMWPKLDRLTSST